MAWGRRAGSRARGRRGAEPPPAPPRSSRRRSRLSRPAHGASSFWATSLTRPGKPGTSSRPPPQRPVRPQRRARPQRRMRPENPGQGSGGRSAREPGAGRAWEAGGEEESSRVSAPHASQAQKPWDRGLRIPRGALPTTGTPPPVALRTTGCRGTPISPCNFSGRESFFLCGVFPVINPRHPC